MDGWQVVGMILQGSVCAGLALGGVLYSLNRSHQHEKSRVIEAENRANERKQADRRKRAATRVIVAALQGRINAGDATARRLEVTVAKTTTALVNYHTVHIQDYPSKALWALQKSGDIADYYARRHYWSAAQCIQDVRIAVERDLRWGGEGHLRPRALNEQRVDYSVDEYFDKIQDPKFEAVVKNAAKVEGVELTMGYIESKLREAIEAEANRSRRKVK